MDIGFIKVRESYLARTTSANLHEFRTTKSHVLEPSKVVSVRALVAS